MSDAIVRIYRAGMILLAVVTSLVLVGLACLVLVSVAVRYLGIFPGSLHWTAELTRFSIIWIVMLGSALALDRGAHVAVDLTDRLPPLSRRVVQAVALALGLVFIGALMIYGFRLSMATMRQISPAMKIPMGYAYLALPVGAAIMLAQSLLFIALPRARQHPPEAIEQAVAGGP